MVTMAMAMAAGGGERDGEREAEGGCEGEDGGGCEGEVAGKHLLRRAERDPADALEVARLLVIQPAGGGDGAATLEEVSDLVVVDRPRQVAAEELDAPIGLGPLRLVRPLYPAGGAGTFAAGSVGVAALGEGNPHRSPLQVLATLGRRLGSTLHRVEVEESLASELAFALMPLDPLDLATPLEELADRLLVDRPAQITEKERGRRLAELLGFPRLLFRTRRGNLHLAKMRWWVGWGGMW